MFFNDSIPYLSKQMADRVVPPSQKEGPCGVKSVNDTWRLGIMAVTLYFIMTYLIYPNPLILLTYEAVKLITI
jgi:hypothetical protein